MYADAAKIIAKLPRTKTEKHRSRAEEDEQRKKTETLHEDGIDEKKSHEKIIDERQEALHEEGMNEQRKCDNLMKTLDERIVDKSSGPGFEDPLPDKEQYYIGLNDFEEETPTDEDENLGEKYIDLVKLAEFLLNERVEVQVYADYEGIPNWHAEEGMAEETNMIKDNEKHKKTLQAFREGWTNESRMEKEQKSKHKHIQKSDSRHRGSDGMLGAN